MSEIKQVHGTDPQFLIEKIIRERIYDSLYWKEQLFLVTAADIVDKSYNLEYVGGIYSNSKPCSFLSLVLKLLMLQPELEIIQLYINQENKYLTALGCFYLRMVGDSVTVYQSLEPLLLDKRKLRIRNRDGSISLTYMDLFIDDLLQKERVCDTILPRLTKRFVLEDQGLLEPRVSPLEIELEAVDVEEEMVEEVVVEEQVTKEIPLEELDPLHKPKKKWSNKKVKGLFKESKKVQVEDQVEAEESKPSSGFKDISLNFHETNILRKNLGLAPLKPPLNATNIEK